MRCADGVLTEIGGERGSKTDVVVVLEAIDEDGETDEVVGLGPCVSAGSLCDLGCGQDGVGWVGRVGDCSARRLCS